MSPWKSKPFTTFLGHGPDSIPRPPLLYLACTITEFLEYKITLSSVPFLPGTPRGSSVNWGISSVLSNDLQLLFNWFTFLPSFSPTHLTGPFFFVFHVFDLPVIFFILLH